MGKREWEKVKIYLCWRGEERKSNNEMYTKEDKFTYFATF